VDCAHEIYRAKNMLGRFLLDLDDISQSRLIFIETLDEIEKNLLEQPGDLKIIREQGQAETYIGKIGIYEGLPQKGIHFSEQAIEHFEICFDYHSLALAQIVLAEAYFHCGIYDKSLTASKRALKTVSSFQDNYLNISALIIFGRINIMMGNLDDSWQALEKAKQICRDFPYINQKAEIHFLQSNVYSFLHNYEKGIEESETALTFLPNSFLVTEIQIGYAINLISTSRFTEGYQHAESAYLKAKEHDFGGIQLLAELVMQIKDGRQKEYHHVCQIIEEISEKAKRRQLNQVLLTAYYLYGVFVSKTGEFSVAQNLFQTVINQSHQFKDVWMELSGLSFLQKLHKQNGLEDENLVKRTAKILDEIHARATLAPTNSDFIRFSWELIKQFE
jgi:tetratricopeptide (TPR) repeat protein